MNGCGHEAMQQQLWSTANAMMVSYWGSFRRQEQDVNSPAQLAPALQVWTFSTAKPCSFFLPAWLCLVVFLVIHGQICHFLRPCLQKGKHFWSALPADIGQANRNVTVPYNGVRNARFVGKASYFVSLNGHSHIKKQGRLLCGSCSKREPCSFD